jgi:hypothetical protein
LPKLVDGARADQREVGRQRLLEQVVPTVDGPLLLALFDHGADAGRGEERRDPGARGPHALGQGALGRDLDGDRPRGHPAVQVLVGAEVAADDLLDEVRAQPGGQALAQVAGVVRHQGQVLDPLVDHAADQRLGVAAQPEAADHHRHPRLEPVERGRDRVADLVMVSSSHPASLRPTT